MNLNLRLTALAAAAATMTLACAVAAPAARAAETFHTCTGFIDSVPAVIATQGTWCLRRDLSTAATSGSAITIAANNVTIDCNGFKLGGLAAGNAASTRGVYLSNRANATVRRCNIRGFRDGLHFSGGSGHVVEHNRFEQNLVYGILILQDGDNLVRDNLVYDTGGHASAQSATGLTVHADVVGNTVSGVFSDADAAVVIGILVYGPRKSVRGNLVRGLASTRDVTAISTVGEASAIDGNRLLGLVDGQPTYGYGIAAYGAQTACNDSIAIGFSLGSFGCQHGDGNPP